MENNEKILEEGYQQAKEVIKACSTKHGLYASAGTDGYNAVWARDSMISLIGASVVKDKKVKAVFLQSLMTLGKHQSKHGQIPNAVDKWSKRKPHVDYASIDSSLWYLIGHYVYKKRYQDQTLFKKYNKSIERAILWLSYQDIGENGLLGQLPTTDWQDAFPHKYGYTINTHALYYQVLKLIKKNKEAEKLKLIVNRNNDKKLWNGNFYSPWRWKNHGKYQEKGAWFDSLGNLLSIVFGLADQAKSKKIIAYIEKNKINQPIPVKAIYPQIKKNTKEWQDYFNDCDAREPYHYLNGGIWTFIGSFYVLSLIKLKKFAKAKTELVKIAQANLSGNFPEWINPLTKEAHGRQQAWNAGMYLLAYESLKKKKVLI